MKSTRCSSGDELWLSKTGRCWVLLGPKWDVGFSLFWLPRRTFFIIFRSSLMVLRIQEVFKRGYASPEGPLKSWRPSIWKGFLKTPKPLLYRFTVSCFSQLWQNAQKKCTQQVSPGTIKISLLLHYRINFGLSFWTSRGELIAQVKSVIILMLWHFYGLFGSDGAYNFWTPSAS